MIANAGLLMLRAACISYWGVFPGHGMQCQELDVMPLLERTCEHSSRVISSKQPTEYLLLHFQCSFCRATCVVRTFQKAFNSPICAHLCTLLTFIVHDRANVPRHSCFRTTKMSALNLGVLQGLATHLFLKTLGLEWIGPSPCRTCMRTGCSTFVVLFSVGTSVP